MNCSKRPVSLLEARLMLNTLLPVRLNQTVGQKIKLCLLRLKAALHNKSLCHPLRPGQIFFSPGGTIQVPRHWSLLSVVRPLVSSVSVLPPVLARQGAVLESPRQALCTRYSRETRAFVLRSTGGLPRSRASCDDVVLGEAVRQKAKMVV